MKTIVCASLIALSLALALNVKQVWSQAGGLIGTGAPALGPSAILGMVTDFGSIIINGERVSTEGLSEAETKQYIGRRVFLEVEAGEDGLKLVNIAPLPLEQGRIERVDQALSVNGMRIAGWLDIDNPLVAQHTYDHMLPGDWISYSGLRTGSDSIQLSRLAVLPKDEPRARSLKGVFSKGSPPHPTRFFVGDQKVRFSHTALADGVKIRSEWLDNTVQAYGEVKDGVFTVYRIELLPFETGLSGLGDTTAIVEGFYETAGQQTLIETEIASFSLDQANLPGFMVGKDGGPLHLMLNISEGQQPEIIGIRPWGLGQGLEPFIALP